MFRIKIYFKVHDFTFILFLLVFNRIINLSCLRCSNDFMIRSNKVAIYALVRIEKDYMKENLLN